MWAKLLWTNNSGETVRPLRCILNFQTRQLLILVEWAAGSHVVNLMLDCVKNLGIFLSAFSCDSVDNVSVLGHSGENSVDEFYDVNHVLLNKSARSDRWCSDSDT